jgi:hypothetical protein
VLAEIMTRQPRRIYTDGRSWPGDDQDPLFTGVSIGNWIDTDADGKYDVLEIETRYLRVPRIYDQSGIPFHEDGQAVIRERIYLDKAGPNLLHNEITTTDHALTSPWRVVHDYRREKKVIWIENNCIEGNDNIAIGNEDYLLSPDGFLMPVKKGQQPTDSVTSRIPISHDTEASSAWPSIRRACVNKGFERSGLLHSHKPGRVAGNKSFHHLCRLTWRSLQVLLVEAHSFVLVIFVLLLDHAAHVLAAVRLAHLPIRQIGGRTAGIDLPSRLRRDLLLRSNLAQHEGKEHSRNTCASRPERDASLQLPP